MSGCFFKASRTYGMKLRKISVTEIAYGKWKLSLLPSMAFGKTLDQGHDNDGKLEAITETDVRKQLEIHRGVLNRPQSLEKCYSAIAGDDYRIGPLNRSFYF